MATLVHTIPFGNGDTLSLTFQRVGSLKFVDGGNHGQHELAGGCTGVQMFFVADQVDALGL